MQARYARDPSSVDAEWRAFFEGLPGEPNGADHGPSWQRRDWPVVANGELVAALDGNWAALEADLGKKIKAGVGGPRQRDLRRTRCSRRRAIRSAPS